MNQIEVTVFAKGSDKPLFSRLVDSIPSVEFPYNMIACSLRTLYQGIDVIINFKILTK